ncbi:uncharacterized protein [Physeter macrocephalus]|uniref:Uncharacterized protein n=1 Tax=Physeter macrocephalus TaxID=9755 RepID=A0A9W2WGH0_PHYMC|nr:uncharacterized protein LOC114484878 [Physeter catodon]
MPGLAGQVVAVQGVWTRPDAPPPPPRTSTSLLSDICAPGDVLWGLVTEDGPGGPLTDLSQLITIHVNGAPWSPSVDRRKPKITASRKLLLKSLMLAKAKECWEQELEDREAEKKCYLAERIPALQTRGLSLSALQVRVGAGLPTGPQDQLQELKLAGSKLRPLQVAPPLPGLHSPVWRGRAGVGRWVPFYRREGSLSREKGVAWGGAEQATGRVSDQRDGAERGAGQRLGGPVSPDLPVRPLQTGL